MRPSDLHIVSRLTFEVSCGTSGAHQCTVNIQTLCLAARVIDSRNSHLGLGWKSIVGIEIVGVKPEFQLRVRQTQVQMSAIDNRRRHAAPEPTCPAAWDRLKNIQACDHRKRSIGKVCAWDFGVDWEPPRQRAVLRIHHGRCMWALRQQAVIPPWCWPLCSRTSEAGSSDHQIHPTANHHAKEDVENAYNATVSVRAFTLT